MRLFANDDTFVTRHFKCAGKACCLVYIDGMVNLDFVNRDILEPLVTKAPPAGTDLPQWILDSCVAISDVHRLAAMEDLLDSIMCGNTLIFLEGMEGAISLHTKGYEKRAITEPELEKVTRGAHEGFGESIMTNLSLIRRRLKTPDLKIAFRKVGRRTNTKVCLCYLDSLVDKSVLEDINQRLDKIDIDGILASNYIEELITDSRFSIFRSLGFTERPDTTVSKLLEGRIAILVDNTPAVLTAPFLFIEYFHSSQDYFEQFYTGTMGRLLRIAGFLMAIIVPGFYVALVTLHQEMVPSGLLVAINAARQQVPLPTIVEVLLLLFAFDLLRESGTRLPAYLGQSLSIVGGLVIGQAAVQARFISAPVVIVVAFTGIASLIIPKLNTPVMVLRVLFILLANFFGLYGVAFGLTGLLLHLLGMRPFGVPYLQGLAPINLQDMKDIVVRAPWWHMIYRPRKLSKQDNLRQPGAPGGGNHDKP